MKALIALLILLGALAGVREMRPEPVFSDHVGTTVSVPSFDIPRMQPVSGNLEV